MKILVSAPSCGLTDRAIEAFYALVPFLKREMVNITLNHIDKAGYWFTFELWSDSRIQIFCVKYTDLQRFVHNRKRGYQ